MDPSPAHQTVGFPRLAVVGEVRADHPLEPHPQVTVVVLVQVAGCGGTSDHRTAAPSHIDRRAEGVPSWMLQHDVGIVATGQLPNARAEPPPLPGVLLLLVLPEAVPLF